MNAKISVIIPVYNVEAYLRTCMDSLIKQTFENVEFICIDDGSTDASGIILDDYTVKDSRVKVFHTKNQGVSTARNYGMTIAQGEYIAFIDSDDWVDNSYFEKLYAIAVSTGADIVKSNCKYVSADKSEIVEFAENSNMRQSFIQCGDVKPAFVSVWQTAIYKSDILLNNHIDFPHDISRKEDMVFLFAAKLHAEKVELCDDVYYYYYKRPYSLSRTCISSKLVPQYKSLYYRIVYLNKANVGLSEYCKIYHQLFFNQTKNYWDCNATAAMKEEALQILMDMYRGCLYPTEYETAFASELCDFCKVNDRRKIMADIEKRKQVGAKKIVDISIIIPVYNAEKYIQKCLDSILSQTIKNIEIICVDDGSTDSTMQLLENYKKLHSNIIVLSQKNSGSGPARNYGMRKANGTFVAFMDADDFYPDNNTLSDMFNAAIVHNQKIVGGSFSHYNDATEKVNATYPDKFKGYTFEKDGILSYEEYQFDYGYHRFIYNREMLIKNKIGFPAYWRYQDPPFFVKAMLCAKTFYSLTRCTYRYRQVHKAVQWSDRNLESLLLGIADELKLTSENNLKQLHTNVSRRINDDFKTAIYDNINSGNVDVLAAFSKVLTAVNPTFLGKEEYDLFCSRQSSNFERTRKSNRHICISGKEISGESNHLAIGQVLNSTKVERKSFRMLFVKIKNGFRCYKENGFRYTWDRVTVKLKNFFKR